MQIRADGEKEIASAVKSTSAARDTAGEYYAKLQSARTDAEVKVKAAVDSSVARLEALNLLSCQYIEKEDVYKRQAQYGEGVNNPGDIAMFGDDLRDIIAIDQPEEEHHHH